MTHYYIKSCYIKNRTAFIISILGCINREITKLGEKFYSKRQDFCTALNSLSYALMVALKTEADPSTIFNTYDCLEATDNGAFYSEIQEKADNMIACLEDDITIHYTGPYNEITTEFIEWLPDFKGRIKILLEE